VSETRGAPNAPDAEAVLRTRLEYHRSRNLAGVLLGQGEAAALLDRLAALTRERDEAREELRRNEVEWRAADKAYLEKLRTLADLRARLARAEDALRRHGRHDQQCDRYYGNAADPSPACSCGLRAAIDAARAPAPAPEKP